MRGYQKLLLAIGIPLTVAGILAFAFRVYVAINQGHASDYYWNYKGQPIMWAQAAVAVVGGSLTVLAMWSLRWWQFWRRSRLEGVPIATIRKEHKQRMRNTPDNVGDIRGE
jgi:hypothetical protein